MKLTRETITRDIIAGIREIAEEEKWSDEALLDAIAAVPKRVERKLRQIELKKLKRRINRGLPEDEQV